jgi:chromate transporter
LNNSLIPGPNSTEIHIGREKSAGKVSRCRNLFYNARSTYNWVFAYFYKKYGQQPDSASILVIKPVIAIILAAIYPLAKKSLKTTQLGSLRLER